MAKKNALSKLRAFRLILYKIDLRINISSVSSHHWCSQREISPTFYRESLAKGILHNTGDFIHKKNTIKSPIYLIYYIDIYI